MDDAFLIYDLVFSDDSDESDEDEFSEEEFLERFLDRNEEGEGDVAMEDEDEDEGNLALRTPMHQGVYVQEEGYRLYQKWRYAGNKKTGWDFLLMEHDENTPLWIRFYDVFGMRQEDFNELVTQARAATKRDENGLIVRRFVDETGGGFRPKAIDLADKIGACLLYVRQNCSWDALSHLVNISPETMRVCFYEFIEWISVDKFHEEVYFPRNEAERDRIESCYAKAGFPGCIGSTDGVHILAKKIPKAHHHAAKKAGGKTSYVVNVVVDMNYIVQSVSGVFYGATNDMVALESDPSFAESLGQNPLFRDAEYTLKDIEGNDVIETGNYLLSDGGYCQDKRLMYPVKTGRLANTPPALCSRRIESVRKDAEDTFSHVKNAFALFEGPVRFSNPTQVTNMVRTLFYLHNRRARSLMHHEVGQVDGDWKPSRRMMNYVPTPVDLEFARKTREGVADGVAGRAQYIANERRVEDRKKNWADRRTRLAQHVTFKDSRRELKWRKTYEELNLPKR